MENIAEVVWKGYWWQNRGMLGRVLVGLVTHSDDVRRPA